MDEGQKTTTRQITAREWLVWIGVGLVLAAVGAASGGGVIAVLGVLLAAVAGFGLVWRLLAGR